MTILEKIQNKEAVIGVVGLGYVCLPLAVEFSKKFKTLGFDINQERIDDLKRGHDKTLECSPEQLASASHLNFSTDSLQLEQCDIYIITVPTPIDKNKTPDLGALLGASKSVGRVLAAGNLVIYESTVYPGCTEEECVPVLEKMSGLKYISEDSPRLSTNNQAPSTKHRNLRFLLRLQPGTDQPGRQRTHRDQNLESHLRIYHRDRRSRRCPLQNDHHRRNAFGSQHQGCRSGQGH